MKLKYRPKLTETKTLPTGKPVHMYFDHPNHNGFSKEDHILAADFHDRTSKKIQNEDASAFHSAQRDLHNLAAQGHSTKISYIPSEVILGSIHPDKQAFWRKRVQDKKNINDKLKSIDQYRMSNVLKNEDSNPINRIFGATETKKKINKSRTADTQLSKKTEIDRQPSEPSSVTQDIENSVSPEYEDILKNVLSKRRAERHGNASSDDEYLPNGDDPRKKISSEQLDKIKEIVANRNRGGF